MSMVIVNDEWPNRSWTILGFAPCWSITNYKTISMDLATRNRGFYGGLPGFRLT